MVSHMEIIDINKNKRTQKLTEQLLGVWETSVRATHLFLSECEMENIKQYVPASIKRNYKFNSDGQ